MPLRPLLAIALVAGFASAAPVPAPPKLTAEQAAEFDRLWDACRFHEGDRAKLYLRLVAEPAAATAYLTAKLPPMAMTEEEGKKLLADLDSEDEKVWKRAYRALTVRDIRLAMTPQEAWDLATDQRQRERLAGLLLRYDGPGQLPPQGARCELEVKWADRLELSLTWDQDGREVVWSDWAHVGYAEKMKARCFDAPAIRAGIAVAALERIGTPAAKKHLQALAEGDESGHATVKAKAALERLKGDPLKAKTPADLWKIGQLGRWGAPEVLNQLLAQPKETVAFLKDTLKPLTLTEKEAKTLLAKLFSDDEKGWKAALAELCTFDLRLAMSVQDAWKLAVTPTARGRLQTVFTTQLYAPTTVEKDDYDIDAAHAGKDYALLPSNGDSVYWMFGPFPRGGKAPKDASESGGSGFEDALTDNTLTYRWQREEAAVRVLDAIGTDDALAVVKAMATGHKDAGPTKVAKEVLKRRGVK